MIALLIPIFALAIPLAGIIFFGLQRLARTRLEEARLRAACWTREARRRSRPFGTRSEI
jgi:hypothetical protein